MKLFKTILALFAISTLAACSAHQTADNTSPNMKQTQTTQTIEEITRENKELIEY